MMLATANISTAYKQRINNVVYSENAARSLTGLGIRTFQPTRHPSYAASQAWFVPITGFVHDRFESDLTIFAEVTHNVDSADICQRIAYAFKQSGGQSTSSLNSNALGTAMNDRGDMAEWLSIDDDISVCSFSAVPYDNVSPEAVTSTGLIPTLISGTAQGSSNRALEGLTIGPSIATQVRHGVTETIGQANTTALTNAGHAVANAGRSIIGEASDAVQTIAGSSQLIKFAVYGVVIFAVVSAGSKLIREIKS